MLPRGRIQLLCVGVALFCAFVLFVQLVFTEVALGAVILTINVILLGGNIVFFQSLCLIGYCLFPIVLAAIICTLVKISVSGSQLRGMVGDRLRQGFKLFSAAAHHDDMAVL